MNPLLMTPGPVPVPPEVLNALALPIEHHRTPAFQKCLERVLAKLPALFGTKQRAFMHVSTGSGGMESLLVNVLNPGEHVAAVVSGKFGERWADMAEAYGAKVDRFEVAWGEAVDLAKFESWLSALTKKPDIVMSQACETSTAVLHPIEAMAAMIRRNNPDTLFLVDAITALGALPLPMDAWDLDGVVGGSQKAFMLPTGLSFVAWSERAWRKIPTAKSPRFYFDIRDELAANKRGETNFSSAVPLVKALDTVLEQIDSFGGIEMLYKRIDGLARATRTSADEMGFELLAKSPSPSLTAVQVPEGIDGAKWRSLLESKYELVLMGGQDRLKGKIIRLGHMGYISDSDLLRALKAIAESACEMKPGAVSEADMNSALDIARRELKSVPMPWPTR
jgi:aspartate aminotransferase-like enzyme